MTFGDALIIFRERLHADTSLKLRTKAHQEERITVLLKPGRGLETIEVRKINKQGCIAWRQVPEKRAQ
jgi:hypothetical protein